MSDPLRDIERLERDLHIGPHAHPYGLTPEGLTDEVRVETEAELRRRDAPFPPLVEREADARAEAERRWPAYFTVRSTGKDAP